MRGLSAVFWLLGALGAAVPEMAGALTISGPYAMTDNIGPSGGIYQEGHFLLLGASSVAPSGGGTVVTAQHASGNGPDYDLSWVPNPQRPNEYAVRTPYTGQTGAWDIVASDGAGSSSARTHLLDDPRLLPLATNLQASGDRLAPLLTWDPFDTAAYPSGHPLDEIGLGTDFYMLRVRVRLAEPGGPAVWDSQSFYTDVTNFSLAGAGLMEDEEYLFDLMLTQNEVEELVPGRNPPWITATENRSQTFVRWSTATPVPEPGTLLLVSSGLLGLAGVARRRVPR